MKNKSPNVETVFCKTTNKYYDRVIENPLLCNQYNENLKNVSRTDKIGANNHEEMIEEEIERGSIVFCWDDDDPKKVSIGIYQGMRFGIHKSTVHANLFDKDILGLSWDNCSLTNPLKD
jgi:hypothetical protein